MVVARGSTNRNARSGSAARRARKRWLLTKFGDGKLAPCLLKLSPKCLGVVDFDTLWVDRFPKPGHEGGTYRRDNIRPSCRHCQELQGALITNSKKALKRLLKVVE